MNMKSNVRGRMVQSVIVLILGTPNVAVLLSSGRSKPVFHKIIATHIYFVYIA